MTNAGLIAALRYHADATIYNCDGCPYQTIHKTNGMCIDCMMIDAADALEAAEKLITELEKQAEHTDQVDAMIFATHLKQVARIAELEAQLPKEGEWIEVHDWLQIPQEERGTYRCSACGQVMKYPWNYCPNCGANMKGERKDGAE